MSCLDFLTAYFRQVFAWYADKCVSVRFKIVQICYVLHFLQFRHSRQIIYNHIYPHSRITTGFLGRNSAFTVTPATAFITLREASSITFPNTTLFPSNSGHGPAVILNKLPFPCLCPVVMRERSPD